MSNDTMNAIVHDAAAQHFTTTAEGHTAKLEYRLTHRVMTITHTEVPPAVAGRGIAAQLMSAALAVARKEGWTVDPACSYAAAYLRRHPEQTEQRHTEELLDEALDESYPASDPPSVGRAT